MVEYTPSRNGVKGLVWITCDIVERSTVTMRTAWIVAASMGYGHLRAAAPLLPIAEGGELVIANEYPGIPDHDRALWGESERFYNFVSRFREAGGWVGKSLFRLFDQWQTIHPLVPGTTQRTVTLQLRLLDREIRHGLGRDLIRKLAAHPVPLVTTFPIIGLAADTWRYPEPMYVVATDSDIARAWAPVDAPRTSLRYFAPTDTAARHLAAYGVPADRIAVTGFPLPDLLVQDAEESFAARLRRLVSGSSEPLSVVFSVGGAGAQSHIGADLVRSLFPLIAHGECSLTLSAGTNALVADSFMRAIKEAGAEHLLNHGISVLYEKTKLAYFDTFNEALRDADVLWTKPSELSFYAAFGIPVLMAPPVGAQEERNREWLHELGAGVDAPDPLQVRGWLSDIRQRGELERMAEHGFRKIERHGAARIMEAVAS